MASLESMQKKTRIVEIKDEKNRLKVGKYLKIAA